MLHCNAALIPRARLRLARLIVDEETTWSRRPCGAMTCPGARETVG